VGRACCRLRGILVSIQQYFLMQRGPEIHLFVLVLPCPGPTPVGRGGIGQVPPLRAPLMSSVGCSSEHLRLVKLNKVRASFGLWPSAFRTITHGNLTNSVLRKKKPFIEEFSIGMELCLILEQLRSRCTHSKQSDLFIKLQNIKG